MFTEEQAHTQVLGIVGSPRRGGNTETLVNEVLRGAKEAEASVEKVILNELQISPCQACEDCMKDGVCIYEDDMVPLLQKMQASQVWVLGTPVYFWGPTAQFKGFLDRWFSQEKVMTFRGRRIILVIPLGGKNVGFARHLVGMLKEVVEYFEMELCATILAPNILEAGEVREHADILDAAYRAGREAVQKPWP